MTTETHTTAGPLAAGAARLGSVALVPCTPGLAATYGAIAAHQVPVDHRLSTWTKGAIAQPATSMVFDRKNRPTRPLSEHSP